MARNFNSANPDKIALASIGNYNFERTNTFSAFCWIKGTAAVRGTFIGRVDSTAQARGWKFETLAGPALRLLLITDVSGNSFIDVRSSSGNTINDGNFHNIGFTYTGSSAASGVTFYIDGVATSNTVSLDTLNATMQQSNTVPYFGYDFPNAVGPFNGVIAEIGVWNITLTAAEASALNRGAHPSTIRPSGLVGYYPLFGLSSPEPDLSGFANNGTLTGTTLAVGAPLMTFTPHPPLVIAAAAAAQTFQPAWAIRNRIVVEGIGI